ncbi:MAG: SemiSWEET transporter [Patescibacteria group bacterium]
MTELIGSLAGACTTLSLVPQVIKIIKTKSTKDVSLGMFVIFTLGVGLWLVYGFLVASIPIIIANSATFVLATIILVCKQKYK